MKMQLLQTFGFKNKNNDCQAQTKATDRSCFNKPGV